MRILENPRGLGVDRIVWWVCVWDAIAATAADMAGAVGVVMAAATGGACMAVQGWLHGCMKCCLLLMLV